MGALQCLDRGLVSRGHRLVEAFPVAHVDVGHFRRDQQIGAGAPLPGIDRERRRAHQQRGDRRRRLQPMGGDPTEETRRVAEVLKIDAVAAGDVDADDRPAMHLLQNIDREIAQHGAVHQEPLLVVDHGRQNPRQRDRGAQRPPQIAAAVNVNVAGDQIGGHREKWRVQIFDQGFAEMLAQPLLHAPAADKPHHRQHVIAKRIAFDERLADAGFDLVVVPAHRRAGADDGAHRSAADYVERQARFAQRADDADMGVGARAAAREHDADRAPRDDARQPCAIGVFQPAPVEHARGLAGVAPFRGSGGLAIHAVVQEHQVHQTELPRGGGFFRGQQRQRGPRIGAGEEPDAVGLAQTSAKPGGVGDGRDQEHRVVLALERIEPGAVEAFPAHRPLVVLADDDSACAQPLQRRLQSACAQGEVDGGRGGDEREHARLGARVGARAAGARQHDAGDVAHQRGVGLDEAVESVGRELQHFAVAHGEHARCVRLARDQRHFPNRLARPHIAEQIVAAALGGAESR